MKIRHETLHKVTDIPVGEVFEWQGAYYIRLSSGRKNGVQAAKLSSGNVFYLGDFVKVRPVDSEIVIK